MAPMAYKHALRSYLHIMVWVFLCALLPRIAHALTADGHAHFVLDKTPVAVPRAWLTMPGTQPFILTSSVPALHAALTAAGMALVGTDVNQVGTRSYDWHVKPDGVSYGRLELVPLGQRDVPRPLWWVRVQNEAPQEQGVCAYRANEPWTLFMEGLADMVTVHDHANLTGAQPLFTNWVDLRHAAPQMELAPPPDPSHAVEREQQSLLQCVAHEAMPAPVPLLKDVAETIVWHSAVHGKRIALTFDACSTYHYGPYNPAVIAALEASGVPATLFVGGHWAEMHPDILESLAKNDLFEIGNHTYSHPHMRDLTPAQQRQELLWTQEIIYRRTGVLPRMFRPPYGEVDDIMVREVARAGLLTVEYDLPAGDADVHVSPARLTHWVVGQSTPGSIVIMHMNRPKNHTAEALPEIVAGLRAKGFTFCRMSDLLFSDGAGCR
jgi:peptidoglycan/xylan/chitin deacetylase (PgdA/CDA1 family)